MAFNDEIMVASGGEYDPEHPSTEKATLENIPNKEFKELDGLPFSTNTPADANQFATKEGDTWYRKAFSKIWDYIKEKLGISAQGSTGKYLDEQGNFTTPPNTTYGVVSKTANGLAPQLPNETTTTKYLRQDGTWQVPPDNNTTYSVGTGDSAGQIKVTPSSGGAYNVDVKNIVKHQWWSNKNNMNDIGRMYPSVGMTNLTDPGNNVDNPMSGTTKSTGWHLYFDASYGDDPNGSNAWVAQIANKAGTHQWWVRSRSGSPITNGTAWASGWRHLATSDQAGVGNTLKPVYVDGNGGILPTTHGFTIEEIYNGYPSAAGSWQTKSLNSGKKFSDYTMIAIEYMQYNNTIEVQTIPRAQFDTQTTTGSRPILYDNNDWVVQVYKVSDTQFGIVQRTISGDVYHTKIWGINKK